MATRETFVYRPGKGVIPIQEAEPLPNAGVRFGSGPMVISDNMPAARHMASGRYHESKTSFRRDTKSFGCVEVGDQAPTVRQRGNVKLPDPRKDIAQAWEQLSSSR